MNLLYAFVYDSSDANKSVYVFFLLFRDFICLSQVYGVYNTRGGQGTTRFKPCTNYYILNFGAHMLN